MNTIDVNTWIVVTRDITLLHYSFVRQHFQKHVTPISGNMPYHKWLSNKSQVAYCIDLLRNLLNIAPFPDPLVTYIRTAKTHKMLRIYYKE